MAMLRLTRKRSLKGGEEKVGCTIAHRNYGIDGKNSPTDNDKER
jgi:hypothetical protein